MVDFDDSQILQWQKEATTGQRISEFRDSEGYRIFKEQILDVIKQDSYDVFATVSADDQISIIGAQQMMKVANRIENTIDDLVQQGRLAVDYLNKL